MPIYRENQPTADILMNSMRSMGYTFESAIADIVDNSLAKQSTKIELKFPVDPLEEPFIAICDNGIGMTSQGLYNAMKYGSETESEERDPDDLGRFGLGLKSASLSQCRKLTVMSKKDGIISAYVWSLDHVVKEKNWEIAEYAQEEIMSIKFSDYLHNIEHGTVVLWEDFDVIEKSSGQVYAELSKLQQSTSEYISLIFHRYLNRDKNKVDIYLNNFKIEGLDPFLENHPKTNPRRKINLPIKDSKGIERMVYVQPYVLPYQNDLSKEDKKLSGGVENYRSKQGFYIYRNERLIIWGTWFNRHRDELTKYARIKVDIPNTLDDIWQIDIKKQNAKIPKIIKQQLTKAVDESMDLSVKKQKYQGRTEKVDGDIDYIWKRIQCRDNVFIYKINRQSKIFDLIKDKVADDVWNQIDMVLEEIENMIPYQQIYIDKSQNKVDEEISEERLAEIKAKAEILLNMALSFGGTTREKAIEVLMKSEPFNQYTQLKELLQE